MMPPAEFEARHHALWDELQGLLEAADRPAWPLNWRRAGRASRPRPDPARLAWLHRRCCEHLALATSRGYPLGLTQRLEGLAERAHRLIYRQQDFGLHRLRRLLLVDFPQAVRAMRGPLLVATLMFLGPALAMGWATWREPGFVLTVLDVASVAEFETMYGPSDGPIGRSDRDAQTDWRMFGFYILNNIGVAFRCFAAGLAFGVGSLFFLGFNGALGGAVAGFLTVRGHGEAFWSFVATHAAFELTAIVLAGAAGLRLGQALLMPGRLSRLAALKAAGRAAMPVVWGAAVMLVIAAAVEAFWSSARWVPPGVKYAVAGACWALVIAYLGWQGRPARGRGDAA